jgi:hypothetical protein
MPPDDEKRPRCSFGACRCRAGLGLGSVTPGHSGSFNWVLSTGTETVSFPGNDTDSEKGEDPFEQGGRP